MMPLLRISNLDVRYKETFAVRQFSLDISPGEVVALVGESGSGKSSLGLALLGLLDGASVSGSAQLQLRSNIDVDLVSATDREMQALRGSDITMVSQEPMSSLNPMYRIGSQIVEAIQVHKRIDSREARRISTELLARMGIGSPERCMNSYPHQLSGGQKQRVAIAMAVANRPQLLVADEPTTALDVTVQAQIIVLLSELRRQYNMAILFITHDLNLARRFADRVVVMYAGEIVEVGPVKQVFAKPRMPYTAALMNSRPRVDAAGNPVPLEPIPGVAARTFNVVESCSFHNRCRHFLPETCDRTRPLLEMISAQMDFIPDAISTMMPEIAYFTP